MYTVYVKTDDRDCIVDITSDAFLPATDGWQAIDSGDGDRYHHAQGNYLDGPLTDDFGVFRYKLTGGRVVERSAAEVELDRADLYAPPSQPSTTPAVDEATMRRIADLEEQVASQDQQISMLVEGVTEDE